MAPDDVRIGALVLPALRLLLHHERHLRVACMPEALQRCMILQRGTHHAPFPSSP